MKTKMRDQVFQQYLHETVTQVPSEAINDSYKGIYARAGDYFRTCLGSGAGESKHAVCRADEWATYTGISTMPPLNGGTKSNEIIHHGRLGFDEQNEFEKRYLGMIAQWRSGEGGFSGLPGGNMGEPNPAGFLGPSARVKAPKGSLATNMADDLI